MNRQRIEPPCRSGDHYFEREGGVCLKCDYSRPGEYRGGIFDPMTPTQFRILCERNDHVARQVHSSNIVWVNSPEGWPLYNDFLDACRAVHRARGLAHDRRPA